MSMYLLPPDFVPSLNEIVIGRGKVVARHKGNEKFREMIQEHLEEYNAAKTKSAKSAILVRVLQEVRSKSAVGAFVKYHSKTKRFYALEETTARINCAQAFRDASSFSNNYRSSKHFKQKRRWDTKSTADNNGDEEEEEQQQQQQIVPNQASSGLLVSKQHQHQQQQQKKATGTGVAPNMLLLNCNKDAEQPSSSFAAVPSNMNKNNLDRVGHLRDILNSAMSVIEDDDFFANEDGGVDDDEMELSFPTAATTLSSSPPTSTTTTTPEAYSTEHPFLDIVLNDMLEGHDDQVEVTANPFEPKPIMMMQQQQQQQQPSSHDAWSSHHHPTSCSDRKQQEYNQEESFDSLKFLLSSSFPVDY